MPTTNKRVGIFSGTFDPVHNGHLRFAADAIQQAALDKVFFLVEPQPRRKQGVKAFEHRQAMVQMAVSNSPKLGSIVLEQLRFTPHETLPLLEARFKGAQLCLLMGDDMLAHLIDWPRVDSLIKVCEFVIGRRRGTKQEIKEQVESISRTRNIKLKYRLFDSGLPTVSSSLIKAELRKGKNPNGLPAEVKNYIEFNGLYASKTAA